MTTRRTIAGGIDLVGVVTTEAAEDNGKVDGDETIGVPATMIGGRQHPRRDSEMRPDPTISPSASPTTSPSPGADVEVTDDPDRSGFRARADIPDIPDDAAA